MNLSCYPSDIFDISGNNISIKKYTDDTILAFNDIRSTDGFALPFCQGISLPYKAERVTQVGDETGFPYIRVERELVYHKGNLRNFRYGAIRCMVKKESCAKDYAYHDIVGFKGIVEGTYALAIESTSNKSNAVYNIFFDIPTTDDINVLSSVINDAINDNVDTVNKLTTEVLSGNTLRVKTKNEGGLSVVGRIKVIANEFINTAFTRIDKASYFSAPSINTKVLSIINNIDNRNEVTLLHRTDGYLYVLLGNGADDSYILKKCAPWDWTNEEFAEIELNFDESLCSLFINGKLVSFFEPAIADSTTFDVKTIIRDENPETYLSLVNNGDAYGFLEIGIFNKKQHCGDYQSPIHLGQYDGNGYIEYNYGVITAYDDKNLSIDCSGNFLFEMYDGGALMTSATSKTDFINKVRALDYDQETKLSFETSDELRFRLTFKEASSSVSKFEFDPGVAVYDENDPYNFEDLYAWVRRSCGAPQITCELTDDQIYDALCLAVDNYNIYRNWNENITMSDIGGDKDTDLKKMHSDSEGTYYVIPPHISENDIIDIFFQPRFSVCWFGAGDNFLNNVMSQTFFGLNGNITQNVADYFIHRSTCNDISNIIGSQISYRIYNHHLYLTPNNLSQLDQFKVGIKYRPSLSVEEIRNNWRIKELTLGYAMQTLGLIRGTFGGALQAGDISVQLNADQLITRGNQLVQDTLARLKSEQRPLMMIFS